MRAPLSFLDIDEVLVASAQALDQCGYSHCVFGSAACYLYLRLVGQPQVRVPNDVDIVVFPRAQFCSPDAEQIKRDIVKQDSRFYLLDAKDPNATYKVLYFQNPDSQNSGIALWKPCKVDILVDENAWAPSELKIPFIPSDLINTCYIKLNQTDSSISTSLLDGDWKPVYLIPSLVLLFLKLKGWEDHRDSPRDDFRAKVPYDAREVIQLTQNVVFTSVYGPGIQDLSKLELKTEFWNETTRRARDFVAGYVRELDDAVWSHWADYALIDQGYPQEVRMQHVTYHEQTWDYTNATATNGYWPTTNYYPWQYYYPYGFW
ncbi:hypothetical protein PM082_006586 [Marasmius tenuissimus]|nr:hypothetical protein PM082_006586 [Marasmius tenuissimus]